MAENRQLFNYHTHTYRCGHAAMIPDEDYVKAAIEAGFKTLGFSDHGPFKEYSKKTDRMDYDEFQGYLDSIYGLKEKYKDQIDIKVGCEFEYFNEHLDQIEEIASRTEYLILGQHYTSPDAHHDYCSVYNTHADLYLYRDLVCKGMESGKFIYLAHPDYFCGAIDEFDEVCEEISRDIAMTAVKTNTPLEVNIKLRDRRPRLYADGYHVMYPYRRMWEIFSEYPIRAVYGFDAHDADLLKDMSNYTKAEEILKGIDLDFVKEELV